MSRHHRFCVAITAALTLWSLSAAGAEPDSARDFERDVRPFLQRHCLKCHDAKAAKAGFRIDELGTDFLSGRTADHWKEVIDRINLGDMPPEGEPRPDPKAAFAVVEWVGRKLQDAQRRARSAGGRILMRRLNRAEYAHTVGDLLLLDPNFVAKVRELLPADGKAEGIDRISAALFFDQTQLEKYLEVAGLVAEEAIRSAPPAARTESWKAAKFRKGSPQTVPVYEAAKHLIPLGADYYVMRDGGFETWAMGNNSWPETGFGNIPPGPGPGLTSVVVQDGYYRVRIRAGGFPGERGEPIRIRLIYADGTPIEATNDIEIRGTLEKPEVTEALIYLRAGREGQKTGLKVQWNGLSGVRVRNPELEKLSLQRLRLTGAMQKAANVGNKAEADRIRKELDAVLESLHSFTGPEYVHNPKFDLKKVPRLFLDSIEVTGPIAKEWPPASHAALGLADGVPQDDAGVKAFFARLLPKAYRRPVQPAEIDRLAAVVAAARTRHKLDAVGALRMGLQAMLCSPGFVFLQEPQPAGGERPLDDYELASRLSYFLWRSMPDGELFRLAGQGKLRDPAVLRAQVSRLLADPKSRRFVEGFAGQWLQVELYGSVQPAKEYKDYDKALELAGREEPLAFFAHVLARDLPVTSFLDSNFVVINERLARHYGIDGVKGEHFRPVAIGAEHRRGGVLGMAGLLTLLSDGTRTLPVRRAAWVLENLLNDPPPPPPPNAGEIQPNTAGKNLSVRQRLELHRKEPTCASCHAKLDGYGLALENYDAIGAWRDKQNGEGFRGAKAPVIDASGRLKSGREFKDLPGYKTALLAERDRFARAFSERLLTYALGRPVGAVDEPALAQLTAELDRNGHRLQALIQAVVASRPFQTK
jgi:mono/diheme cytochrome c family protein